MHNIPWLRNSFNIGGNYPVKNAFLLLPVNIAALWYYTQTKLRFDFAIDFSQQ